MVKLKISFSKDETERQYIIKDGELLNSVTSRVFSDIPGEDKFKEDNFNVVVNGNIVEKDLWENVKLKKEDNVLITPKIGGGESGQIFKQILIIAAVVIVTYFYPPAASLGNAFLAAGVTIGATLLFNALIPPPALDLGGFSGGGSGIETSQMYAITGQSNQVKRLGTVPKVYGSHRMYPIVAVTPYTELAVSPGVSSQIRIQEVRYKAAKVGTGGNKISVAYTGGGTAGSEVVTVSGNAISVKIQSGVSTALQIKTKVNASTAAYALVSASITGTGSETQITSAATKLVGGEVGGETVQYLYGIYDFGLGTPQLSDLKIGDTPLNADSFSDFEYRLVDPVRGVVANDQFDELLSTEFKYYSNKRTVTPLSLVLVDGEERIQVTDNNPDLDPQEIIIDFVCPSGLFGYSSRGAILDRRIQLEISFALVGTFDWKAYNDTTFVSNHSAVGGNDLTDFEAPLAVDFGTTYYQAYDNNYNSYNSAENIQLTYRIKPGQKKLLVIEDPRWTIGTKVYFSGNFLGIIASIIDLGKNLELTLDRNMAPISTFGTSPAFTRTGSKAVLGVPAYTTISGGALLKSSRHQTGAAVITDASQAAVYGHFRFTPLIAGQYQVRVRRVITDGSYSSQKGDGLNWVGLTTAFKSPPVKTDKRHVFLELRIKATDQLNGHIQNLSAVASSVLPVYDDVTQTWTRQVTNNPAWAFCDLLTGEVNKKPASLSRLDMDSIVAWADYCDEVPTPPPSATYLEPRFQCNFILDYETTLQGVLQQVGSAAQASLNIIEGKYGVLIDKFKTVPVQIFTPRNSKDFSSTRIYGPRPHAVRVKYIDPQVGWGVQESTVYDNGFTELNATDFDELTSFACTNYEQAWRFGRYMIAQNKLRQETMNLTVDFENLVCTRGDYVQITQDVMRVGGTPARVKSVTGPSIVTDDSLEISPSISYGYVFRDSATGIIHNSTLTPTASNTFTVAGTIPVVGDLIVIGEVGKIVFDCIIKSISPNDDMSATLVLVERAQAIFDYESTDTLPDYDPQLSNTSNPEFFAPLAVVGLTASDNSWRCADTKSGYEYYVDLAWDISPGSVSEYFEIWVNDGRGYSVYDKTVDKFYRYPVVEARLGIEHGFKVVAVSASGKKLQLIEMPEVLETPEVKNTPPSDVDVLDMSITDQVMQLSWNKISDCDCASYEIRYSPGNNDFWEASIPLLTVTRDVNTASVQARTGVYMIKAIDFAGNQSANAARTVTSIPNLFDLNVIETINDAPTFVGEKQSTILLGSSVILATEIVNSDPNLMAFYDKGYYVAAAVLDLGDVYTVRLQSQVRADGYRFGELMSNWIALNQVDNLNSSASGDWDVGVEYRATDVFAAMSDWAALNLIDHINYGAGVGFTTWRPIPTIGDATGRIFQFRVELESLTDNVTPRLFDATIKADMPDRVDSFENQTSHISQGKVLTYENVFNGPGTSPNVQVSIDNAQTGDYWSFDYKTLAGLSIRFFDKTDTQVVRQFDIAAKGYGRRHTTTI